MKYRSVNRGIVSVWRWELLGGGLLAVAIVAIALLAPRGGIPFGLGALAVVMLFALVAGCATWYPAARYRHLGYRLEPGGIFIRDGVFWRQQSFVARVRIQHTDVSQGPLERHYGVATLKLHTAGSRFTKIELPGLAHDDAIGLRDELQREGDDDAV